MQDTVGGIHCSHTLVPDAAAQTGSLRLGQAGGCQICPPGAPRYEAEYPREFHDGLPPRRGERLRGGAGRPSHGRRPSGGGPRQRLEPGLRQERSHRGPAGGGPERLSSAGQRRVHPPASGGPGIVRKKDSPGHRAEGGARQCLCPHRCGDGAPAGLGGHLLHRVLPPGGAAASEEALSQCHPGTAVGKFPAHQ